MAGLLTRHPCFQASGARPCGSSSLDSLVSDSQGQGRLTGLQQRKPCPQEGLGGRGAWAEQSQGRGVEGWGREVEPSVHPSWVAEVPTRLPWHQPRQLYRRPPRLSSRQCLSGQFGGSQQMACPHACGQRQRVRGAQLKRSGQPSA